MALVARASNVSYNKIIKLMKIKITKIKIIIIIVEFTTVISWV